MTAAADAYVKEEQLIAIARGDFYPGGATIGDIADELLRLRRFFRGDRRRAEQVRRLRWSVELLVVKVEELQERLGVQMDKAEVPEHELRAVDLTLERAMEKLEQILEAVRAIPPDTEVAP